MSSERKEVSYIKKKSFLGVAKFFLYMSWEGNCGFTIYKFFFSTYFCGSGNATANGSFRFGDV